MSKKKNKLSKKFTKLQNLWKEGRKEGRNEGRKEGRKEGRISNLVHMIQ